MSNDSALIPLPASHRGIELGVLGAGRMGVRLAVMFARAGRLVVLGARDPVKAQRIVAELGIPNLSAGSYEDAIAAPAVLPAIFLRDGLDELLKRFGRQLDGKLLIDISNPFNEDYSDFILPWDDSSAELLQRLLPGTSVVGAYKHVFAQVFDAPLLEGRAGDVIIVGNDARAKDYFLALAKGTPFRYIDAGSLIHARTIERLTLITGRLGREVGTYPRMNWKLLGEAGGETAETRQIDRLLAA
ncbi:NADPH-dependent F420 reductase [Arenimonas sp.]|uniref:NADPH-dependent F420 reductase n=1 Tax=Arenimonas sp. TaxID=1872635 RepID=UPI0039E7242C